MRLITEDLNEYVANINSVTDMNGKGTFAFHRTDGDVNGIRQTGMSREFEGKNGQCYGPGLYMSLRLPDCISNRSYGHNLLKLWIPGYDRCLVNPNQCPELARNLYGDRCSIDDQLERLVGIQNVHYFKGAHHLSDFTSTTKYEKLLQEFDIDGVIYDWGGGHWVCVWKDYKKVFPYAYSNDDGETFKKLGDETTLRYTLKTWEPQRVLGKDFDKYENAEQLRAENGYFLVKLKNGGYNYINPLKGKFPISKVFFDLASQVDADGLADVEYNGKQYIYDVTNDDIYKDEVALDMGNVLCKSAGLNQLHESIIIHEALDEYVPDIARDTLDNRNGNLTYFYRLAKHEQTKSIGDNGFSKEFRGTGSDNTDWVGSGTYGIVDPTNRTSGSYGSILWKYATPTELIKNTYISPNPYLARRFGIEGNFAEQLKRFFPDLYPKWQAHGIIKKVLYSGFKDKDYSKKMGFDVYSGSAMIRAFNDMAFKGSGGKSDYAYHSHGINGIIYHGQNDGDAVITFDDSTIIPVAWRDNGKYHDSWHPIEISDNLWNRTYNGYDPLVFLKGTYKDYHDDPNYISQNYRVRNGYMLVVRKIDHKCNYVKAPEGGRNFASPIWFENASPVDENGISEVMFNGKHYFFTPEDGSLFKDEAHLDMDSPSMNVHDLMRESKGIFGNLLEEILKK